MTSKVNLFEQVNGYFKGTKAAVEALSGIGEGSIAYATDTNEFGSYDGAAWTWGQGVGGSLNLDDLSDVDAASPADLAMLIFSEDDGGWVMTNRSTLALASQGVTNGNTHNHSGGDGGAITIPIPIAAHGLNATIPASTTYFTCPNVSGVSATEFSILYTIAGTLRNLYIRIGAQPASGSLICTLRVNNADTALTITIPAGSAAGNYGDTTHTVTLNATDRISWKIINNATAASAGIGSTVVELDAANV